ATAVDEGAWGRVALAVAFTVVGVALLAVAWRARGRTLAASEVLVVRAAAAWTVGVWIVRGVQIALADHEAAFVVVHLVLAVVSIALALATVHALVNPQSSGASESASARDRLAALGE
ncbi:MAG TPA: hypothetical protein VD926_14525, partial [Acidimicrobiales bacterium]|nr:hypothetical protein [Acidimicrobiales bacterium]